MKGFGASAPRLNAAAAPSSPLQLLAGLRELVGPRVWSQMEPSISAMLQLRDEPVLLTSPRVLIVK
jgi:hypothetical protein